jgi:hypothetical protein
VKYPGSIHEPAEAISDFRWAPSCITLTFPDDSVVLIPKGNFTRGRQLGRFDTPVSKC